IRIAGAGVANGDRYIFSVTDTTITLTTLGAASGTFTDALISKLVRQGAWEGDVTFVTAGTTTACAPAAVNCRQIVRSGGGWLADGFLEGQRVRVCTTGLTPTCADFKIALIRG